MTSNNLSSLFAPDPSRPAGPVLGQGIVQSWDGDTGANTIQFAGGTLVNIPSLTSEAVNLAAGDVVALLVSGDRMLLVGKVTTPGDPGTVPTWNADLTALAPLVDVAAMTVGTTITGVTNVTSDPGDGAHVVINDPAYPGQIVLKSGNAGEVTPGLILPVLGGANFGVLRLLGPDLTGSENVALIELEGFDDGSTVMNLNADGINVRGNDVDVIGFDTGVRVGSDTTTGQFVQFTSNAISEADLSSPTNIFPATSAWTNLPLVNGYVSAGGRTAQYCKDMTGRVQLRGRVSTGTSGATIATLPAGSRPTQTMEWTMRSAGGIVLCAIEVRTDGTIVAVGNASTVSSAGANLDMISFPTN